MRSVSRVLPSLFCGSLLALLLATVAPAAAPRDAADDANPTDPGPATAGVEAEVPAEGFADEPAIVSTRFYWPKFGSARVAVEQVENDQSLRYSMELYVTPAGDDQQGRAVRLAAQELLAMDGIDVAAMDEHDADREVLEFKLRLAPARYLGSDGSYRGCDNVSDLIQANLAVFSMSDQLDAVTLRRLQREMTSSTVARQIKSRAQWEMLEWAGFWSGVELARGKARTVKRMLPMEGGGEVQVDVTYLWQGSVLREGTRCEKLWLRTRIKDEAFRRIAAPIIRRSGIALLDSVEGEQVITASIVTDPYTLLPLEVTAQYNTVVQAGEVERAHVLARKATFSWEKGKDVLTHAEGGASE